MPVQGGLRKDTLEHGDERNQRTLLSPVECVGWAATPVKAPDIADTDAVLIVTIGMGTNYFNRPPDMDGTVEIDEVMITDIVEPPFQMAATNVLNRIGTIFASGRTMDDDVVDFSHIKQ